MTPKETPPKENIVKEIEFGPEPVIVHEHHKQRKHGYRGYPNNPTLGGDIHTGAGFGGVGSTSSTGSSGPGLITEKTREAIEELGEEKE